MPKKTVPAYCHHKGSGQARVRIDGRDVYLGVYGSPESRTGYAELIAVWFARQDKAPRSINLGRLALLSIQCAKRWYRKRYHSDQRTDLMLFALTFLPAQPAALIASRIGDCPMLEQHPPKRMVLE